MGSYMSKLYDLFSSWNDGSPSRILLLGLDGAGKTTMLYKVKLNETVTTIPTIGFNVETVTPYKGITFTVWDVGGQCRIRPLWRYYFHGTDGLMYVVDSSDVDRLKESAEELFNVCQDELMQGIPVVVMANKQDLSDALPCSQLIQELELYKLSDTKNIWQIQECCAVTGEGIYDGLRLMSNLIGSRRR